MRLLRRFWRWLKREPKVEWSIPMFVQTGEGWYVNGEPIESLYKRVNGVQP